jgi:hypothetical protein
MKETLVQVTAPHFCAGLVLWGDHCIDAAPILRWAIGKERSYLSAYFKRKRWRAIILKDRDDVRDKAGTDGALARRGQNP